MPRKLLMFPAPLPLRRFPACLIMAAAVASSSASLRAEDLSNLYTRPSPPSREALDRLSVQVLEKDLFVQTRGGVFLVVNAETGEVKWRTRVGEVYRPVHPVAYNSRIVFAVSDTDDYALDRTDGHTLWVFRMPGSAA